MTSWIHATRSTKEKKTLESAYYYETADKGFCSEFNKFFYAYITAKERSRKLYVTEQVTAIANKYPLLQSTFVSPSDVEFSTFPMSQHQKLTSLQTYPIVWKLTTDYLREQAKRFFTFKDSRLQEADAFLSSFKNFPKRFDMGVHIRAGDKITTREMSAIPIDSYVSAIRAYQIANKKETLDIFVMTDTYKLYEELASKADESWAVYTLDDKIAQLGHNQGKFNDGLTRQQKEFEYRRFITELLIMRNLPYIVCTLSSNVGRWLYLLIENVKNLKSLDVLKFAPV